MYASSQSEPTALAAAGLRLFCVYAPGDEDLVHPVFAELEGLRQRGVLLTWQARPFVYEAWRASTKEQMAAATVVLLLLSDELNMALQAQAGFLPRLLQATQSAGSQVLALRVRRCQPLPQVPLALDAVVGEAAEPRLVWGALCHALEAGSPRQRAPSGSLPNAERSAERSGLSYERIDKYKVLKALDQGGMGQVLLAVNMDSGRKVALKVLLPELCQDERFLRRFQQEVLTSSRVSVQGAVQVFDSGRLPSGQVYLVMEFLDGESLRQRLRRAGRLPQALPLIAQAASVLSELHEQGIVHRDLKPENIMVVRDSAMPGGERAKVLDFGISKVIVENFYTEFVPERTNEKSFVGTPHYMAPEQAQGQVQITAKADVYALGAVLYELLSGKPPFHERTEMLALLLAHQSDAPLSLLQRGVTVPAELAQLIERMLAKAPAERPTMAEVAAMLKRFTPGELSLSASAPMLAVSQDRALPPPAATRARGAAVLGVGAALLLVGGSYAAWMPRLPQRGDERPQPPVTAPSPRRQASFLLTSLPSGAAVRALLDGQPLTTACRVTPCTLTVELPSRPLTIVLSLEGYEDRRLTLTPEAEGQQLCLPCQEPLIIR